MAFNFAQKYSLALFMPTYKPCIILCSILFHILCCSAQEGYITGTPALAYWTIGNGPDIVIVLHGGPAAGHSYLRPEWDSLSKVAKVVYFDQRGCGKSEKAPCYSWREQVADVKRVITHLKQNGKVVLAGSSWASSWRCCMLTPFRKM